MYIIQHDYRDQRYIANLTNATKRHCKIGRVKYRGPAYPERGPFDFVGAPHIPFDRLPQPRKIHPVLGEIWC